jgi:hypothetical protein
MKTESKKASRLTLTKETVASLRVRSGVATGMGVGGGAIGGGGALEAGKGFVSLPVAQCVSVIKSLCPPPPPPPPPTGSALCF